MRAYPLLAVVVIIIFQTTEASQIFNKYFFLKIHTDLGLFTQVHQASPREAIVLVFLCCASKSVSFIIKSTCHPSQDRVCIYTCGGQNGYKSYAGRIFSNQKHSRVSKHDLGTKHTILFSNYHHPRFKHFSQAILIISSLDILKPGFLSFSSMPPHG